MSRVAAPLVAALLALAGSSLAMFTLYHTAAAALDSVLDARLRAAGQVAAQTFAEMPPDPRRLKTLMSADDLEGAFVVDRNLNVVADATGPAGRPIDLLRVDPDGIDQAWHGRVTTAASYSLGDVKVASGYFPIRDARGDVREVLTLEAGQAFADAHRRLSRSLIIGCVLALITALALAMLAAGWGRTERSRQEAAMRAARGAIMSRMAAMAAHEIRNPLMVIRATVELMNERSGASLQPRDREALSDVIGEVDRLHRLTQDLVNLAADTPLTLGTVDLPELLNDAARACEVTYPAIEVKRAFGKVPQIEADAGRLRQVVTNLLTNAAQAQSKGEVELSLRQEGARMVVIRVHDDGPGIPIELRERLFDPLMTTKKGGTGLGLALSRKIVERHGGTLSFDGEAEKGASFEVKLPLRPPRAPEARGS